MKILVLTPQLPYPPRKGTATRNFHLLRHLATRHDVHLLTFAETEDKELPSAVRLLCSSVHGVPLYRRGSSGRIRDMFLTRLPDLALRLASEMMTQTLAKLMAEVSFDVVQIEGLEMFIHWKRAVISNESSGAPYPLLVFDDHNCEYLLQKRAYEIDRLAPARWHAAAYSLVQWRRLVRYEAQVVASADGVIVVSEEDREALSTIAEPRHLAVVQNCVDAEFFAREDRHQRLTTGGPNLVFTGTMDFRPNVDAMIWFCKDIFGRIRRAIPEAKLWIVGANPKEEIKRLSKLDGVVVTGFVEDIRQFLDRATVYVVPMRFGGGTRLKVLEAMAAGLPVVSTSMGCQGIRATDAVDILVADRAPDFAEAVVRLLSNPHLRQALGSNARKLALGEYDWQVILPRLDDFYDELLGLRKRAEM